jgi:hypothetical protein
MIGSIIEIDLPDDLSIFSQAVTVADSSTLGIGDFG